MNREWLFAFLFVSFIVDDFMVSFDLYLWQQNEALYIKNTL